MITTTKLMYTPNIKITNEGKNEVKNERNTQLPLYYLREKEAENYFIEKVKIMYPHLCDREEIKNRDLSVQEMQAIGLIIYD